MGRYRILPEKPGEFPTVTIEEGETVRIGRAPESDIVLTHPLVSGHHAVVDYAPDGPVLTDLESKNGTWVNGERIEVPQVLAPGDRIVVGGARMTLAAERDLSETTVMIRDEREETRQIHALISPDAAAWRNLAVIHAMGDILLEVRTDDELSQGILDLLFDILPAERACVLLAEEDRTLSTRAARSRATESGELVVSKTILRRVMEESVSLLTSDAAADERFREGHSIIVEGIHAAMCAPIRGRGAVLGAIYADTRLEKGAFTTEDLGLLTTVGILGGLAMENRRLSEANLTAERLAAIGGVVAGLSHDIRNIVTGLRGGAFLLDELVSESESSDLREAWTVLRDATATITELVDDMVSYSKDREPDKRAMDLNALVRRATSRFDERVADSPAILEEALDPGIGQVHLDRTSIDRLLTNLVKNALDALGDDAGTVRIATYLENGSAVVEVRDDGPGIPPENLDRIFDLLYSTKGTKGTGFGLAIAKKIAMEHAGSLTVELEPGKGATFRLTLPRLTPETLDP